MYYYLSLFFTFLFCLNTFLCQLNYTREDLLNFFENGNYSGDKFPKQYLEAETPSSTLEDLDLYFNALKKTVHNLGAVSNDTEANKASAFFLMKVILLKTIEENEYKISSSHLSQMKEFIKVADLILDSYLSISRHGGWQFKPYLFALLYRSTDNAVYSTKDLSRNRLKQWILSKASINNHVEQIDSATFPKDEYVLLLEKHDNFFIDIEVSDFCISQIPFDPEPTDMNEMQQCNEDSYCLYHATSLPAIAYGLSHKLLLNLLKNYIKRCYMLTEEVDNLHLEILCSFMYRETVYLARRGYFMRDLFLEHISLCGMLGYEEFFRRHWFRKIASWVDEDGCLAEEYNCVFNVTQWVLKTTTQRDYESTQRRMNMLLQSKCHDHPMGLALVAMAHGIRHTLQYLPVKESSIHSEL